MGLEKYVLNGNPMCCAANVVSGEHYRISMLTTALVRLEYSENGEFEDRPTQMVVNRDFAPTEFKVSDVNGELHIYTKDLEIHYDKKEFTPGGLMIRVAGGKSNERVWHYGEAPRDLLGTARTLDEADGAIPLEHGILSKNGFSLIDDSKTMALKSDGTVEPRVGNKKDIYFFGYGHRYLECLKDFYYLCGETPLLPRYTFGNWWSRYHRYTETEYKDLIERFEREEIPFSVAVVDMDWHLVDDVDPIYGSGWTGYTWNKKFFPNPKEFMGWLHEHHMKITLNVHPADGIRAYEDAYERVATKMGMDPEKKEPVLFDVTDPKFMEVYFEELHHPMEEEGVDFWWVDWQQGTVTKVPGLDPLWMLNHYHYLDNKWKGTRPLTFSRYAGPGSHRYPVGFSGDTVITWESLQFQPYFTANASNIGYGWWSHDIGGHMMGYRDDELTARWVQLGVFSPINRLHSTDNPFNGKEPWKYNKIVESVMKAFLKLRHALVPYLYTMNYCANKEGKPLVMPMYYLEPEREEAYQVPNNYYFGSELMVSPITEKIDTKTQLGKAKTWLPSGVWYDFFNGRKYEGGRMVQLFRGIEEIPVLAREGAIVPLKNMEVFDNDTDNPKSLEMKIFPGKTGSFTLWEDEGDSVEESWVETKLEKAQEEGKDCFIIHSPQGNTKVLPEKRCWKLDFVKMKENTVSVLVDGKETAYKATVEKNGMCIEITEVPVNAEIKVVFENPIEESLADLAQEAYEILEKAQISYNLKSDLYNLIKEQQKGAIATLASMELEPAMFGALCEILTAEK